MCRQMWSSMVRIRVGGPWYTHRLLPGQRELLPTVHFALWQQRWVDDLIHNVQFYEKCKWRVTLSCNKVINVGVSIGRFSCWFLRFGFFGAHQTFINRPREKPFASWRVIGCCRSRSKKNTRSTEALPSAFPPPASAVPSLSVFVFLNGVQETCFPLGLMIMMINIWTE